MEKKKRVVCENRRVRPRRASGTAAKLSTKVFGIVDSVIVPSCVEYPLLRGRGSANLTKVDPHGFHARSDRGEEKKRTNANACRGGGSLHRCRRGALVWRRGPSSRRGTRRGLQNFETPPMYFRGSRMATRICPTRESARLYEPPGCERKTKIGKGRTLYI